jgi:hypothetical protein
MAGFVERWDWGTSGTTLLSGGEVTWGRSVGSGNTVALDGSQSYSGSLSLVISDYGSKYPKAYVSFVTKDLKTDYRFRVRHQESTEWNFGFGDGGKRVYLYSHRTNRAIYYKNPSGIDKLTGVRCSADQWYTIEVKNISWESGLFDLQVDDALIDTFALDVTTGSSYSGRVYFGVSSSGGRAWFDEIEAIASPYAWPQRFPINLAPPAVTDAAQIVVEADWDGDGDFDAAGEDISDQVKSFVVEYGRDEWLEDAMVGTAQITLHDTSGTYLSYNTSSQIVANFGGIYPGRRVRIRVTKNSNYWLFNGFLDDCLPNPKKGIWEATLKCVDGMEQLKNVHISTGIKENVYSGGNSGIVHLALDQAGWPWCNRNVDTNENDSYSLIYVDDKQCLNFLNELAQSEFAFTYVDNYGDLCWEDRYYRLLTARSVSSQWVCSEDKYINIEPTNSLKSIMNKIVIKVQPRRATTGLSSIWALTENASSNNSISITAGETKTFWASYQAEDNQEANIAKDVQAPTSTSGDYTGNAAQDGTGTDMTANLSVSTTVFAASALVRVKNTHATDSVYLTKLRLRGNIYKNDPPVKVIQEDTSSQALYSMGVPRVWERELPYFQGYDVVEGMALNLLTAKCEPSKGFTVQLINKTDEIYTQILDRHVSDKVTLQNTDYLISGDFYIEKVRWEMEKGQGGKIMRAEWRLLDAASIGGVFWILDTSQLGDGYLYPTRLAY